MTEQILQKGLIAVSLMRQAVKEWMLPAYGNLKDLKIETKLDKTIVTNIDRGAEEFLTAQLAKHFPDAIIIGEESVGDNPEQINLLLGEKPLWVIDALDGTYNFAMNQPGWGVLVTYLEQGKPVMAITLDGLADRDLITVAGYGVFVDGKKVETTFEEKPVKDQIGRLWSHYYAPAVKSAMDRNHGYFHMLREARHKGETTFVEIGFMFLDGRLDFMPSTMSTPWDFLPLKLMLDELGGRVAKLKDGHAFEGPRLLQREEPTLVVRYAPQWEEIRSKLFDGISEEQITAGLDAVLPRAIST